VNFLGGHSADNGLIVHSDPPGICRNLHMERQQAHSVTLIVVLDIVNTPFLTKLSLANKMINPSAITDFHAGTGINCNRQQWGRVSCGLTSCFAVERCFSA
jgi:hypothetical protein